MFFSKNISEAYLGPRQKSMSEVFTKLLTFFVKKSYLTYFSYLCIFSFTHKYSKFSILSFKSPVFSFFFPFSGHHTLSISKNLHLLCWDPFCAFVFIDKSLFLRCTREVIYLLFIVYNQKRNNYVVTRIILWM